MKTKFGAAIENTLNTCAELPAELFIMAKQNKLMTNLFAVEMNQLGDSTYNYITKYNHNSHTIDLVGISKNKLNPVKEFYETTFLQNVDFGSNNEAKKEVNCVLEQLNGQNNDHPKYIILNYVIFNEAQVNAIRTQLIDPNNSDIGLVDNTKAYINIHRGKTNYFNTALKVATLQAETNILNCTCGIENCSHNLYTPNVADCIATLNAEVYTLSEHSDLNITNSLSYVKENFKTELILGFSPVIKYSLGVTIFELNGKNNSEIENEIYVSSEEDDSYKKIESKL